VTGRPVVQTVPVVPTVQVRTIVSHRSLTCHHPRRPSYRKCPKRYASFTHSDFLVSDTAPGTGSNLFDPRITPTPLDFGTIFVHIVTNPTPPLLSDSLQPHRAPSHLACNLSTLPDTTKSSLFVSTSGETIYQERLDNERLQGSVISKKPTKDIQYLQL
jgi:hypothetical protein